MDVLVPHEDTDGCSCGPSFEKAGEDIHPISFFSGTRSHPSTRPPLFHLLLDVFHRKLQSSGAAIDDHSHGFTVRLPPGGNPKERPERISSHLNSSPPSLAE